LAKDPVWFVRLRAIVSLGELCHRGALPFLSRGLTDSNRLVRLRAAEGLVCFKADLLQIFENVVALKDQYGLHAFVTALENAGLQANLVAAIQNNLSATTETNKHLLDVLRTAKLTPEPLASGKHVLVKAASQP